MRAKKIPTGFRLNEAARMRVVELKEKQVPMPGSLLSGPGIGATDFSSDTVTIFVITPARVSTLLTAQSLNNTTAYRNCQYTRPSNNYCDIADLNVMPDSAHRG